MLGPTGMVLGPIPVPIAAETKSVAPGTDSSVTQQDLHSDNGLVSSSVAAQKDSKVQQESRPTSSLLAAQVTNREPFLDKMMTQTNLLILPPSNPSYQMAYFLKTTGPMGERAIKPGKGKRLSSAMRLFKPNSKRLPDSLSAAHQRFVSRFPREQFI